MKEKNCLILVEVVKLEEILLESLQKITQSHSCNQNIHQKAILLKPRPMQVILI